MKVATGRNFYDQFGAASEAIEPDIQWSLMNPDGSWSRPPDDCDTIILADDVYTREFMEVAAAHFSPTKTPLTAPTSEQPTAGATKLSFEDRDPCWLDG